MGTMPEIPTGWTFTEVDDALSKKLQARVPERIFDFHAHVYRREHIRPPVPHLACGPQEGGYQAWREHVGRLVGADRLCGALLTPYPSREGDMDAINDYVAGQLEGAPGCFGSVVVGPDSPREKVEARLAEGRIRCLKPYHVYARRAVTLECTLEEYVPQWAWELAEERALVILLHMVRLGALSDPQNQRSIRRWCKAFPNARLVLAHAARGFHAPNTVEGVASLRGLENVWFDTAAVCEAEPIEAILREFGPRRLLFGTDFPVSHERGRCVTLGSGFAWVATDQVQWNEKAFFGEPIVVGLESLRALLAAADSVGLNEDDLRDVFCRNAQRVLGTTEQEHGRTQALYRRARAIIPGGTQLLSKRPEMFAPEQWPAYFSEARGCEVWDLDGRHYYDVSTHGIGACLLGFRDPDVTRAVQRRLAFGSFCTLNAAEDVELAVLLCELHPWAEQVRYARTGGEIMSVAVRIARATTDRSAVAVCGYHGWHDWYLAANLGETDALRGHLCPSSFETRSSPSATTTGTGCAASLTPRAIGSRPSSWSRAVGRTRSRGSWSSSASKPTDLRRDHHRVAPRPRRRAPEVRRRAGHRGLRQDHEQRPPDGRRHRNPRGDGGSAQLLHQQHLLDRERRPRCRPRDHPQDAAAGPPRSLRTHRRPGQGSLADRFGASRRAGGRGGRLQRARALRIRARTRR